MFVSGRHEPLLAFPKLPEAIGAEFSHSDLALRPFGFYESDLDVDFNQKPQPLLITQILESCTRDVHGCQIPRDFFWRLTVGKRIECLLALLSRSTGTRVAVAFRCSNQDCDQELEFGISLEEIVTLQEQAYAADSVVTSLQEETLTLRRPTGSDQLTWLSSRFVNEAAVTRAMLRTLVVRNGDMSPLEQEELIWDRWLGPVEQALEEHDPLVYFRVVVSCCECGLENAFEIDLENLALDGLRQAQLRLLKSVHKLATRYHWNEQEIFAVPSWRRARYLEFIEREKN